MAALALALLASWTTAPAAWSDSHDQPKVTAPPTSDSAPSQPEVTAPPTSDADAGLTLAQVQAQIDQAEALREKLIRSDAKLAEASAKLSVLSAEASVLLEKVRQARQQQATARAEMLTQLRRLTAMQGQVKTSKADLGRWAREAYTTGGQMASYGSWITTLQGRTTNDVGHDLAVLGHVGVVGSTTLDRLELATAAQKDAADRAATAASTAAAARARADAAKKSADALLGKQRAALAALQVQQLRTVDDVQVARQQLSSTGAAAAFLAEARLAATIEGRPKLTAVTLEPGECTGLDTSSYDNGQIPTAALCPAWAAPGHLLRGDAAAAFRRLSQEYTLAFETPICVTDSYRTRAGQVAVFAAKPHLAAVPGTSNHGWGTAVDLCGGIQSFGTPEHAWLLAHAPLYGWFHPAWAAPTGSKPEPWHWEFAG